MTGPRNDQARQEKVWPATVVKVYNQFRVVINRGTDHGVEDEDEFRGGVPA